MKLAVFYLMIISAVVIAVSNLIYHASAGSSQPWHLAATAMACLVGFLTLLITSREN